MKNVATRLTDLSGFSSIAYSLDESNKKSAAKI
jgi:hypothetical protein